jgi:hypothetical protein
VLDKALRMTSPLPVLTTETLKGWDKGDDLLNVPKVVPEAPRLPHRGLDAHPIETVITYGIAGTAIEAYGVLRRGAIWPRSSYVESLNGIASSPPAKAAGKPERHALYFCSQDDESERHAPPFRGSK